MKLRYTYLILVVLLWVGCKEPFDADLPSVPQGYLVVEGFINAQGSTTIKLSRTTPVDQKKALKPEVNAQVKIEGDDNSSFSLLSTSAGNYVSSALTLSQARKYRLRIKTSNGKEYLSEFLPVKTTPPIDSISWEEDTKGVTIYANTHDNQNQTIYYRWDFDETWEINSAYTSNFRYVNGIIRPTFPGDPEIYHCWKYDTSSTILIASSAKLSSDIIHLSPLLFIPSVDERIGVRYSVMVRQYALDKEGYQFYEQMKKNTESLGSIFDPQPSAVRGNIHSVSDASETVIGYIPVSTMQEKRMFISAAQLRNPGFRMYNLCMTDTIVNHPDSIKAVIPHSALPYEAVFQGIALTHYLASTPACVDCRQRGGINVKPSYW